MNLYNKYDFYLWVIIKNLREKKLFLAQMNRNHLDLILTRGYLKGSTRENLRCFNSAVFVVNEIIL